MFADGADPGWPSEPPPAPPAAPPEPPDDEDLADTDEDDYGESHWLGRFAVLFAVLLFSAGWVAHGLWGGHHDDDGRVRPTNCVETVIYAWAGGEVSHYERCTYPGGGMSESWLPPHTATRIAGG